MPDFQLVSPFPPAGDQPAAIDALVEGLKAGKRHQALLGVTGSGKTFTMANVIARMGRPALVMSHNKTLAAQLYGEFREFFPHNAVRYFVSYYDYYQPEAYIPQRDIYIEKDASINDEIERLRLACTSALVSRPDVIVVASVSCIYGLGSPEDYRKMMVRLQLGDVIDRDEMLLKFVDIQYDRNDIAFERGKFRVRGDVVELWPAYEEVAYRIELFGDEVDALAVIDPVSGSVLEKKPEMYIYPAKHFVLPEDRSRGPSTRSARRWTGACKPSRSRASCWRPSAWRRGRATTWRCSWRSATARASRTTAGTSPAASPARRPTPCWTSSRPRACCSWTSRT
jgi:excinuclease ABC subunit B